MRVPQSILGRTLFMIIVSIASLWEFSPVIITRRRFNAFNEADRNMLWYKNMLEKDRDEHNVDYRVIDSIYNCDTREDILERDGTVIARIPREAKKRWPGIVNEIAYRGRPK
jgi:hypothetical protein